LGIWLISSISPKQLLIISSRVFVLRLRKRKLEIQKNPEHWGIFLRKSCFAIQRLVRIQIFLWRSIIWRA